MKLVLALTVTKWFSAAPWRRNSRQADQSWAGQCQAGTEHRVRFEDLSPHILRDLGFSTQHARDLMAQERARFLS